LAWTEHLVEDIETALEQAGVLGRPERVPAMCFLDLVGYTRLTEERGDRAAAELAGALGVLVGRSSREHGGVPVKWLGDGVMVTSVSPPGPCCPRCAWSASCPRPACRRPMLGSPPGRW
jgi:class 3 adenylate cyclase